jgi:hypothetical protein
MQKVNLARPHLRLMFYGQPGSTKTRTAGTAALDERTAPVLWLDSAGNPVSLIGYKRQPDVYVLEKPADLSIVYDWLYKGQPAKHPMVDQFGVTPGYKTVVVDGITDLQRQFFALVAGNANKLPGQPLESTQIQHFNTVLASMVNFAKYFYSLPMHVIMTALEREDEDKTIGQMSYKPLLWGQSAGEVPGFAYAVGRFMHVSRLESKVKQALAKELAEESISVVLWRPSSRYVAKDQYGTLGTYMVDPSVPKIMDAIYGSSTTGGAVQLPLPNLTQTQKGE